MLADLHLHTTESDGTWTPAELVKEAADRGLALIAITDHDTICGIDQALAAAAELGTPTIGIVPGIELSTLPPGGEEVHIVGLWIDTSSALLKQELTLLRLARRQRALAILERLRVMGISLGYAELDRFVKKDAIGRSHIAAALVAKGVVDSKRQAFAELLGQGYPAYVERGKLTPERAIELILGAQGVPVLAHPGLLKDLSMLPALVDAGLVGLETVHSAHSPQQTEFFGGLARRFGLLPSGGSDCHGPKGKDEIYLGRFTIPMSWAERLAARSSLGA